MSGKSDSYKEQYLMFGRTTFIFQPNGNLDLSITATPAGLTFELNKSEKG
jgi:hypothetical protein